MYLVKLWMPHLHINPFLSDTAVLSKQIEGIHGALAELRRGLKADIAELRGEVETIKTDIAGLRDEVKTDIAELRGEIAYARERGGLGA